MVSVLVLILASQGCEPARPAPPAPRISLSQAAQEIALQDLEGHGALSTVAPERVGWKWYAFAGAAHAFDGITAYQALRKHPNAVEVNPLTGPRPSALRLVAAHSLPLVAMGILDLTGHPKGAKAIAISASASVVAGGWQVSLIVR